MTSAMAADPMLPRMYRVTEARTETGDTRTLDLVPANGSKAMAFEPGQFNMLYAFGVGEIPVSISGDPADPDRLTHTTRGVGAVSRAICELEPGACVGVRGPFGHGWPVEAAETKDLLIITGGIGLAPLRPAIYHVLSHRDRYDRATLLYGARSPHDLLYPEELALWRGRFDMDVNVTVDAASAGWRGNVGVVTTMIGRADFDPLNTVVMICGPEVMMRFTLMELGKHAVPEHDIHLSMERNMKCAIGFCGHCQYGPAFVCKDGPVFAFSRIKHLFQTREI